ncbi:hypothetical protein V8D89_007516 [Ganoderma adspersum]
MFNSNRSIPGHNLSPKDPAFWCHKDDAARTELNRACLHFLPVRNSEVLVAAVLEVCGKALSGPSADCVTSPSTPTLPALDEVNDAQHHIRAHKPELRPVSESVVHSDDALLKKVVDSQSDTLIVAVNLPGMTRRACIESLFLREIRGFNPLSWPSRTWSTQSDRGLCRLAILVDGGRTGKISPPALEDFMAMTLDVYRAGLTSRISNPSLHLVAWGGTLAVTAICATFAITCSSLFRGPPVLRPPHINYIAALFSQRAEILASFPALEFHLDVTDRRAFRFGVIPCVYPQSFA